MTPSTGLYDLRPSETCVLRQDESRGEPVVLLRRDPGAPVETLTIQEAHNALDFWAEGYGGDPAPQWWTDLFDLLAGIR